MDFLRTLHITYLWPVLTVGAILYVAWMLYGLVRNTVWQPGHRIGSILFLALLDLQVFLGALLWIIQQRWSGTALLSYEHPLNMIIALVIYHVGYRRLKKAVSDRARFTSAVIWGVACLVVFGLGIIRVKYL